MIGLLTFLLVTITVITMGSEEPEDTCEPP